MHVPAVTAVMGCSCAVMPPDEYRLLLGIEEDSNEAAGSPAVNPASWRLSLMTQLLRCVLAHR